MTDDRLVSAVTALERVPVRVGWSDVERRLDADTASADTTAGDASARPHRGRLRVLLAVAALAVVVAALTAVWPDADSDVRTGPGPVVSSRRAPSSPPTTDQEEATTTTTAPEIGTTRTDPVVAFTGKEYLVWSGETEGGSARSDGFTVDVHTAAVRPIPAAPISARFGATGVWTGSELIVCCGAGRDDGINADTRSAAAWNPSTGEWRTLAPPPASVARQFPAAVWTGELMIVMATQQAVATYDPATDRWEEAPTPYPIRGDPEAVWTGEEVILWDPLYGGGVYNGAENDRGWRWAPGRKAWEPLPPLPPGSRTRLGSMGWTGTDIVVWGQSTADESIGTGARWRPGDQEWRPMKRSPQAPVDPYNGTPGSQAVVSDPERDRVLIRGLDPGVEGSVAPLLTYSPASDRWTTTEIAVPGFHPPLSVAGDHLVVPDQANPVLGPVP